MTCAARHTMCMKLRFLLPGLATLLAADLVAAPPSYPEPPRQLVLTVDGKTVKARAGEKVRVGKGPDPIEMVVDLAPARHFDYAGLAFDYPEAYGYAVEAGADLDVWTISGNDCTLMVFRYPQKPEPAEVLKEFHGDVAEQMGATGQPSKPVTLAMNGRKLEGLEVRASARAGEVTQPIVQEMYAFQTLDATMILVVQDVPASDTGEHTEEYRKLRALLSETLAILSGP